MKKSFFILPLLTVLFFACTSSNDGKSEMLSVKADLDKAGALRASEYFEEVTYVPLETSDEFLIDYARKTVVSGNSLYVMCDKSVHVFSTETGKGKNSLSKLGNGPDEYKSLTDFIVGDANGNIELLDNRGKKILVYDSFGNLVHDWNVPAMAFSIFKKNSHHYCFYNGNMKSDVSSSRVMDYDVEVQEKIKEYFPIYDNLAEYFHLMDEKVFNMTLNGLYFHVSPIDTIYKYVDDKGFVPAFHLDFMNHAAPASFYEYKYRDIMEFSEAANKNEYVYALTNFAVNGVDDVLFSCRLGKTFYWTVCLNGKPENTANAWMDDFHFTGSMPLTYHNIAYCLDDEYLYFFISAEQLIDMCEEGLKDESMRTLIKSAGVTEESNPILVKCKLKK